VDGRPDACRSDKHTFNLVLAAIPSLRLQMVWRPLVKAMGSFFKSHLDFTLIAKNK
jgi:hypothetical protein